MSLQEEEPQAEFLSVKGSMCKVFCTERVLHKTMGIINPVHVYEDPRRTKATPQIEPKAETFKLASFSQKYKEKSFLPQHLTSPFIYIERVIPKDPSGLNSTYRHPDEWNKSNNVVSTRVQTQIPKLELNELTRSLVASKREPNDKNDYEQNERMKRYLKFFFKEINKLLQDKRFSQQLSTELTNPTRLLGSTQTKSKQSKGSISKDITTSQQKASMLKNPKDSKLIKEQPKEFIQLNKDYSLKQLWVSHCTVKKINFDGDDDQEIVDIGTFREFIKALGYLEKKWNEIDKFYNLFNKKEEIGLVHPSEYEEKQEDNQESEFNHLDSPLRASKGEFGKNSSLMQWRPARKKLDKATFSMKAFIFNYDKFLKDQEKIPYILSTKAAAERKETYNDTKEKLNTLRDLEDKCKVMIKEVAGDYDDPEVKKFTSELNILEEGSKKGHRLSREEKNQLQIKVNASKEKMQDSIGKFNELYTIALDQFQNLCNEKDRLFYEKRVMMRFLRKLCESPDLLIFSMVEDAIDARIGAVECEVDAVAQFYENFIQEKNAYDEQALKLYELANYIHENNYTRDELDTVTYFVRKIKSNYNISRGEDKKTHLNPNQFITLELFKKTYTIYRDKREHEVQFLSQLLEKCRDLMDQKMPHNTIDRVKQKIEYNMMYDFFQKTFDEQEDNMEVLYSKITNIIQFVFQFEDLAATKQADKYRNKMGFLLWGIFDESDEYISKELKEKIEAPKNIRNVLTDHSEKPSGLGDIFGGIKKTNYDDDDDNFFNKISGSGKNQMFGSIAQSDDDIFNTKIPKMKHSVEDDDDFAIDALNNKNANTNATSNARNNKRSSYTNNDNEFSGIYDFQSPSDRRKDRLKN